MADKTEDLLKITYISIDELKPYPGNPRLNDNTVPFLQNSMRNAGFLVPIVVDKDHVIASGHTRLKAIRPLIENGEQIAFVKGDKVPCVYAEDLTPEQIARFRLEDNRVSDYSEWDFDILIPELKSLSGLGLDPEDMGFDIPELNSDFLDDDDDPEIDGAEVLEGDDWEPQEYDDEPLIRNGDIISLGRHTVMCGDATSDIDMLLLMGSRKADIAFTSPPYNAGTINRDTREREGDKYIHDKDERTDEDYEEFLAKNLNLLLDYSNEVFYNVGLLSGSKRTVIRILDRFADRFKDMVYWKKSNPVPGINDNVISSATEWIMAFGKNPSRAFQNHFGIWYGVIEGPTVSVNEYRKVHRATFPLYLPTEMIEKFCPSDGTVLDSFMGTGTTLIAAEDTGRTAFGMEIEPLYCQIIIDRYAQHVGSEDEIYIIRNDKKISWTKIKEDAQNS